MIENDPQIAEALDALLPIQPGRYDWDRVIADAQIIDHQPSRHPRRSRWTHRRLAFVTTIVSMVLLIPVIAVGASRGWWFQQTHPGQPWWSDFPRPVSGSPAIIATGHWHRGTWTMVAFISKRRGYRRIAGHIQPIGGDAMCIVQIDGALSNPPSGAVCGSLHGMQGLAPGESGAWATWVHFGNGSRVPPMIVGAAANGVARVKVILNPYPYFTGKARTITAQLTSSPLIGSGIHFFVVRYPTNVGIDAIVLYNAHGKILKQFPHG